MPDMTRRYITRRGPDGRFLEYGGEIGAWLPWLLMLAYVDFVRFYSGMDHRDSFEMTAYYNENNRRKAAALRELIRCGLIAPGDVDERSSRRQAAEFIRAYREIRE